MRVFVTGATGFIGSAIVNELIANGHDVLGLARSEASGEKLRRAGARVQVGTVEDLDCLRKAAGSADGAIHTARCSQISRRTDQAKGRVVFMGTATLAGSSDTLLMPQLPIPARS